MGNSIPASTFEGVVTTYAGISGKDGYIQQGYTEGDAKDARFFMPISAAPRIDPHTGVESIVVSDTGNRRIRLITPVTDSDGARVLRVSTLAGNGKSGNRNGPADESEFDFPRSVCVDPTNPNRVFVCDTACVRVINHTPSTGSGAGSGPGFGLVSHAAGGPEHPLPVPPSNILNAICTPDGSTLLTGEPTGSRVTQIDTKTGAVSTALNCFTHARGTLAIAFDRAPGVKPGSVVLIGSEDSHSINRWNRETGEVTRLCSDSSLSPHSIVCLSDGSIIFTSFPTHSIYRITDRATNRIERIAGSGQKDGFGYVNGPALSARFSCTGGLAVVENESAILICDGGNHAIRRLTIAPPASAAAKKSGTDAKSQTAVAASGSSATATATATAPVAATAGTAAAATAGGAAVQTAPLPQPQPK